MISPEVAQRIREIEIFTRRLVSSTLMGDASSAIKGTGLDFDQLREYQMGDDVRFIDWKASSRTNQIMVRQYIEDRNRTIIIALDVSGSTFYGSGHQLKSKAISDLAGILALVGYYGKDHVGLIIFSDKVHTYIPARAGKEQVSLILEKIFSCKSSNNTTDLNAPLDQLLAINKRNALVFLISDFIGNFDGKKMSIAARLYDLIAIRYNDNFENLVPRLGYLMLEDIETGQTCMINTRKKSLNQFLEKHNKQIESTLTQAGVQTVSLLPHRCSITALVRLFRQRMSY